MGLRRWNEAYNTWESFGTAQVDPASIGAAAGIHATQHAQGGLDPVLPANIGAISVTNGSVTTASTSSGVVRNIFTSTGTPTGGIDGDIWLKYV